MNKAQYMKGTDYKTTSYRGGFSKAPMVSIENMYNKRCDNCSQAWEEGDKVIKIESGHLDPLGVVLYVCVACRGYAYQKIKKHSGVAKTTVCAIIIEV